MQCIAQYTDTPDSRTRLVHYKFGQVGKDLVSECDQCTQESFVVEVKFCEGHKKVKRSSGNRSQDEKFQLFGIPSVEEFTKKMKRRQQQKRKILTHSQLCQLSFKIVFAEEPVVSILYSDDVTPGTVRTLEELGYNCEVGPSNKLTITPEHTTVHES